MLIYNPVYFFFSPIIDTNFIILYIFRNARSVCVIYFILPLIARYPVEGVPT